VAQNNRGICVCQGDMLFYRLACVHMRTTGIALYLGPKSHQSSTGLNFQIDFFQGALCWYPACLPNPMPEFLQQGGVLADIAAEI